MIYLRTFKLSDRELKCPNIYPYSVFRGMTIEPFVFESITVISGDNGTGKSTLLNIIANKLNLVGKEYTTNNRYGTDDYCGQFSDECSYTLGEDEDLNYKYLEIPTLSRYIKSEDILYEIKKVQQRQILEAGLEYDFVKDGYILSKAKNMIAKKGDKILDNIMFAQEKYSNGETALQYFEEFIQGDALYLLDEPEVSLSPQKQVELAEMINKMSRYLGCQFIIATHSPFMLGTLNAKVYNIEDNEVDVVKWHELKNVRCFYDFFKKNECKFI